MKYSKELELSGRIILPTDSQYDRANTYLL